MPEIRCQKCGNTVLSKDRFCRKCGCSLSADKVTVNPINTHGQFTVGFFGFITVLSLLNLLVVMIVNTLFDPYSEAATIVTILVLIVIQVIGIGRAIRTFRSKLRRIGIGNFCAIFLFILGAILRSGCMPPLVLPFPLSLMSAC